MLPLSIAGREPDDGVGRPADRPRRPARPPHPPPERALRRPAAARRRRARAGHPPGGRLRRRADRQPRLAPPRPRSCSCCAARSTSSARRSSWSPTTRTPPPTRTASLVLRDGQIVEDRAPPDRRPASVSTPRLRKPPRAMRKIALRGLLARKVRLALTALAVALGVTLIAGTYIFTDTINKSFDNIFVAVQQGHATSRCRRNNDLSGDDGPAADPRLGRCEGPAGRRRRAGRGLGLQRRRLVPQGRRLQAQGPGLQRDRRRARRPALRVLRADRGPPARRRPTRSRSPRARPTRNDFKVGDKLQVAGRGAQEALHDRRASSTISRRRLLRRRRHRGHDAARGPAHDRPRRRLRRDRGRRQARRHARAAARRGSRRSRPHGVEVRTGKQQADKQTKDINDSFLDVLRTALLAFAGISLFVGAFLIFNTFSITVAQRTREFALLRMLGAKRRQVLRSVLAEGLVIGLLGSAVGLGLGIAGRRRPAGAVQGLRRRPAVDRHGHRVAHDHRLAARRHVVTLISTHRARRSARRACRRSPRCARALSAEHKRSRWATPLASRADRRRPGAHGARPVRRRSKPNAALSLHGPRRGADVPRRGVPQPAPGRPDRRRRRRARSSACAASPGRLARENTVRQPGRTAVTAAALMIGVALVTFASVFAAGAKTTFRDAVDQRLQAQAVIQNTDGFCSFSPQAAQPVAERAGRQGRRGGALRPGQGRRQEAGRHRHRPGDVRRPLPLRLEAGQRRDAARSSAPAR